MKLFFDARFIKTDLHDGISRYSAELGTALHNIYPVTFLICDIKQLNKLPKNADYIIIHSPVSIKEAISDLIINKYNPDVVYTPMQTINGLNKKFKLILTVHDTIYYRHRTPPSSLNIFIKIGWVAYHSSYVPQRLKLKSADVIATVSQTSKKEIINIKLANSPVVVIYNAAQNLDQYLDSPVLINQKPINLVYMGSFMKYKNVETLIKAMKLLPDHTLHLLSRISTKRKNQLMKLISNDTNVVFHNGVTDKEYANILANRAILVSASKDEGYGLPIAEALQLGVPAVISDLQIFHEVADEGALYFPAEQSEVFARQVLKLDNYDLRIKLSKAGKNHISQFSWEKSAQILLKTARNLVGD